MILACPGLTELRLLSMAIFASDHANLTVPNKRHSKRCSAASLKNVPNFIAVPFCCNSQVSLKTPTVNDNYMSHMRHIVVIWKSDIQRHS